MATDDAAGCSSIAVIVISGDKQLEHTAQAADPDQLLAQLLTAAHEGASCSQVQRAQ